jgi:acetoacetyl-CoA synthetase
MHKFMQHLNKTHSLSLTSFRDLHAFSLSPQRSVFWAEVFKASRYLHSGTASRVVGESAPVSAVPRWFEGVYLNFAENILHHADPTLKRDGDVAVTEVREGGSATRSVTWGELRRRAGRLAAAMKGRGVGRGDRVVVVGANSVETLVVWLATAWVGGVFSSSSTDMGVSGILGRSVQVGPKLLFFDDAAVYNGKTVDLRGKVAEVVEGLKVCEEFQGVVVIPRFERAKDVKDIPRAETWEAFVDSAKGLPTPGFERIAFHEPLMVCYSSGTTGMPKAIVHSVGGAMISYFKEGVLHESLGPEDVILQYTTVGWIMYMANVCGLLFGARSVMYDGSPFLPDAKVLVRIMEKEGVTKLGISPRWMLEMAKNGIAPRDVADLSKLRIVTCTGMVLSDQLFEWFYDKGFPKHVHLANISGGTDIVSLQSRERESISC